jgi:hypothetical protein
MPGITPWRVPPGGEGEVIRPTIIGGATRAYAATWTSPKRRRHGLDLRGMAVRAATAVI